MDLECTLNTETEDFSYLRGTDEMTNGCIGEGITKDVYCPAQASQAGFPWRRFFARVTDYGIYSATWCLNGI